LLVSENHGTSTDPTEPGQLLQSFELDESVLRAVLDCAPGYISLVDPDLRIRYISALPEQAAAKLIGSHMVEHFTPKQMPRLLSAMQEAKDLGTEPEIEYFVDAETGQRSWHLSRISVLRDEAGAFQGFVLKTTDITDQKNVAQQLRKSKVDLVETLHEAGEAEVAAGVLHELSHLLKSVDASTGMLLDELSSPHVDLLARTVALCEEHGASLPDFLARDPRGQKVLALLSRVTEALVAEQRRLVAEVERLEEEMTTVRSTLVAQQSLASTSTHVEEAAPSELVERALAVFRRDLLHKRIDTVVEVVDDTRILTDKQATQQILINLIRNAIEAVAELAGTRVLHVRVHRDGEHVLFEVMDNGCGIAADDLSRLFRQGFTTKRRGHGFALHASAIAAQAMGGSLTAESQGPGQGACFCLSLPRTSLQST
jgi:PAS domain S-box-containing protein